MDAGRLRFFPAGIRAEGDCTKNFTSASRSHLAIFLTLAMRPSEPLFSDGRRPLGAAAGPDDRCVSIFGLRTRLRFRAEPDGALRSARPYGVAMGGEWGVGASLTMETSRRMPGALSPACCSPAIPRDISSASIVYGAAFPVIGWRGMFMLGVMPALLVLYIRRKVPESPVLEHGGGGRTRRHARC